MAKTNVSFPKIADSSWWKLRALFIRKVPAIITPSYLASGLSMSEASANSNLIGPFKKIGIIDNDGKPTDLAYDWRDDHKYADVCKTLIEKYYPEEIRDLFHSPDVELQKLSNWFMNKAKCGMPAANMYARFYLLLLKADLNEAEAANIKKEPKIKASKKESRTNSKTTKKNQPLQEPNQSVVTPPITPPPTTVLRNAPELHINLQLHISPESSADQIDKIFESMAKHLKNFNK